MLKTSEGSLESGMADNRLVSGGDVDTHLRKEDRVDGKEEGGGGSGDNSDEERWLRRVGRMQNERMDGLRLSVEDSGLCQGLDSLKTLVIFHIRKSRLLSRVRIQV